MSQSSKPKPRNSLFHFKQFSVADNVGAMKIGTDSVILGAWASIHTGGLVWDAGSGSGVLGLMVLQRGAGHVVGFELNDGAAAESRRNIARSPWPDSFEVKCGDFNQLSALTDGCPELIISNPPFFTEDTHSPDCNRSTARHEDALNYRGLLAVAARRLSAQGSLCVIAPFTRLRELEFEGELQRLHLWRIATLRANPLKAPKRVLLDWRLSPPEATISEEICIRDEQNRFTGRYTDLTGSFYLDKQ